ncbi:MAG: DUF2029 domain-containing protein [Butyrivibrio sp.]|nr:DUF2029 domain-containing protein [Butyrivibrio sp.]
MKGFIDKIKNIDPLMFFSALSSIGIISFFVYAYFYKGVAMNWLVIENNSTWELSDHFRQVGFGSDIKNVYMKDEPVACFPPLAYLFYNFLYNINPILADDEQWLFEALTLPYEPILVIMLMIFISVLLLGIVFKILNAGIDKTIFFMLVTLFSVPFFAGAIERGNIIFLVLVMLLYALYYKDSDKPWQRECALILIAVAAAFKITPAIFGLLYLKEKRFKEAGRLVLYGILFFFVPFIFCGGIDGIFAFINVLGQQATEIPERWSCISGFVYYTFLYKRIFGAKTITKLIQILFLVLMILGTLHADKKWKEAMYLTYILAFFSSTNYRYTLIYLFIPVVFLIRELRTDILARTDFNYMLLIGFALIFTIPTWWIIGDVEHWGCGVAYLIGFIAIAFEIINFFKEKKQSS